MRRIFLYLLTMFFLTSVVYSLSPPVNIYSVNRDAVETEIYLTGIDCELLVGGSDGDFCSDSGTAGGTSNFNAPWLYNVSEQGFFNDTFANLTYDNRFINAGENDAITLDCSNVTGAAANLCTIVDGSISAQKNTTGFYLYNDSTDIFFNETMANSTFINAGENDAITLNIANITGIDVSKECADPVNEKVVNVTLKDTTLSIRCIPDELATSLPFLNITGRNGTLMTDVVQSHNGFWGNLTTVVNFPLLISNVVNVITLSFDNTSYANLDIREAANNITQGSQILAVVNDILGLNNTIETLNTTVENSRTDISNLIINQSLHNESIINLENNLSQLSNNVSAINDTILILNTTVENTRSDLIAINISVSTLNTTVENSRTDISNLIINQSIHNESIANLEGNLTTKVNKTGDTMTGDLNVNADIFIGNTRLRNISVNDGLWNGSLHVYSNTSGSPNNLLFTINSNGSTSTVMPHFWIQVGGVEQASGVSRSFMIVNEVVDLQNTINITSCRNYMNWANETLQIDCNTTTTGADLLVGDDLQVVGDVWLKDSSGSWHFLSRELDLRNEMFSNITITGVNGTLAGTNFTIRTLTDKTLVINIDGNETILNRSTDNITLTFGTNETPILNQVFYTNSGIPTLSVSNTLNEDVPSVATFLLGDNFTYASLIGGSTSNEFIRGVYNRFLDQGTVYKSGFDINVTTDSINISTGTMKILLTNINTDQNHSSSLRFFEIHDDGDFHQHVGLDGIDEYATGEAIGNNRYFNLICGIVVTHDFNGTMHCIPQNNPDAEHTSALAAELDQDFIRVFPLNDLVKKAYTPIVRVVIQRSGGVNTIQTLSTGFLFLDLRGTIGGFGGSPPIPGVTDHGQLTGLVDDDHTQYYTVTATRNITGNINGTQGLRLDENITLGQQITFAFGEMIDNIIDRWIRLTGNVQVNGELNVTGSLNVSAGINGSLDCSSITGGVDGDFCDDATGASVTNGTGFTDVVQSINVSGVRSWGNNTIQNATDGTIGISTDGSIENAVFTLGFNNESLSNLDTREAANNASQSSLITELSNNATLFNISATNLEDRVVLFNTSATNLDARQAADNQSICRLNVDNTFTGDTNIFNNITVDWINFTQLSGSIGWINLTDYPNACTTAETLTAIGDTLTCTAISITESQISDLEHVTSLPVDNLTTGNLTVSINVTNNITFTENLIYFNNTIECLNGPNRCDWNITKNATCYTIRIGGPTSETISEVCL